MVNDTLGGRQIGIPYCILCLSAQAYFTDRVPGFAPLLRTSGLLSRSIKLMFDLRSGSVIDTFTGKALSGPMRQAGVEVRPIHQITGESEFNEVFITDARVPHANLVGEPGGGWAVLQLALAHERRLMGDLARTSKSSGDLKPDSNSLIGMARAAGRLSDSHLRQEIAVVEGYAAVNRWNTRRAKNTSDKVEAATLLSLGKIAMSRILHETARVQTEIAGGETMLAGPDHPVGDAITFRALNAYFTSIGGGTDQIQRNIVGERILGLPKEPEPYRDTAFRDLPH